MTKYTISGIEHMIRLLNQHPQLLSLSSMMPIAHVGKLAKEAAAASGCNCKIGPIYAANKGVFEEALRTMQNGDHLMIKSALKVDQLCWYVRDHAGNYVLKCV